MKNSSKIYKKVRMGTKASIGDFCIVGLPFKGATAKTDKTSIGNNPTIRSHTVIYAGNKIGNGFQTGHSVIIRELNTIGDNVSIGTGSDIEHHVIIGNNVRIHSNVFIPEYSVLEDSCWIGPNVVFTNAVHPQCPKVKECLKGPVIKKGAKIGANSTLLPGVTVGENALVGAGAVVVNDIPPGKVAVGNPARVIKDVGELKCSSGIMDKPYSL